MRNEVPAAAIGAPHPPDRAADRFAQIAGNRIHYSDEGSGPTLLFVHAGPAWSFIYRDLIALLRNEFRCIAFDFPGSGLSEAAPGYTARIESAAAVFEEFIRQLELNDVSLIVHDLGRPVALKALADMPERFLAVAVTDSFAWSLVDESPGIVKPLRFVSGPTFGFLNDRINLLARATASSYGAGRHLTPIEKRAFRAPYRDRVVRRNAVAMLRDSIQANDYLRRLDQMLRVPLSRLPLLLVFGDDSPTYKERFPAAWMARFPRARLVLVEGGHHFPIADDPDLVAGAIRSWWHESIAALPEGLGA